MTMHPLNPIRSERGIALIVVLLLLGVMAALTTGLSLSGSTEAAMASNETYYAGARSAAEAGMNRAVDLIVANNVLDLTATGVVPGIGNGPFALNSQYGYSFQILDDDNPILYPTLTPAQLAALPAQLGENNDIAVDNNTRMILRAIGTGPNGTTVIVSRMLVSMEIPDIPDTDTFVSNPAVLVNGDLNIAGNATVKGSRGNVHANGNVTGGGSETITGDLTATGQIDDDLDAGGLVAGNMPGIAVPEIKAADFKNLADFVLTSTGDYLVANTPLTSPVTFSACTGGCIPAGWTFSGGEWSASGSMPAAATYYVEGPVSMHGTGKSSFTQLSLIAEGSIKLTGNGKFKPENDQKIQFVTNGDFELGGTVDGDDTVDMDGQIMVREQIKIYGTSEFQGRVMVEDRDSDLNEWHPTSNPNGRRGGSTIDTNTLSSTMTVTYNGSLGDITTTFTLPPGPPTYTNYIRGWMEQ
jgi:hypothetical protein